MGDDFSMQILLDFKLKKLMAHQNLTIEICKWKFWSSVFEFSVLTFVGFVELVFAFSFYSDAVW